jgi:HAMP domain-containing protein
MLALAFNVDDPVLPVVIAAFMTVFFAVPMTVGAAFSLSLQPIRDLAAGTERLAKGDYSQPLPVVQDDDLGALVASFNRAQAGLAERQRLQGAFGTYVDPQLATRLLEQGDYVFSGERREVTVMFVDIRDFTAWAEANTWWRRAGTSTSSWVTARWRSSAHPMTLADMPISRWRPPSRSNVWYANASRESCGWASGSTRGW